MNEFQKQIKLNIDKLSFSFIRQIAIDCLRQYPKDVLDEIYESLKRGKCIIDDDDHLNMYLKSFGLMHKAKLDDAFNNINQIAALCSDEIEIFDWGCGQGTAIICFLDYLREKGYVPKIKRINLIEPSKVATRRAKYILSFYDEISNAEIRVINKGFDNLNETDIKSYGYRTLHLFSNILDVTSFDLADFTHLFQQTQSGLNTIICVGPYYSNNRRVDDFVAAINPSQRFASYNKPKGCWLKDWTISVRAMAVRIEDVELPEIIRARIIEAQKHQQFFGGYILDWVDQVLLNSPFKPFSSQLLRSLSTFDVDSDCSMQLPEDIDPLYAVMNNIISRGLPTKAPINVEETFSRAFDFSSSSDPSSPFITYPDKGKVPAADLFEALHVIDPRFILKNYNDKVLESSFERYFIYQYLKETGNEHLAQLFEPQRWLSSIVKIPNGTFGKDIRTDFSIELPYSDNECEDKSGFIVEIDGQPYHSDLQSRLNDALRDRRTSSNDWDTFRLKDSSDFSFVSSWEQENTYSYYLHFLKQNYHKELKGEWNKVLQSALCPFAIARIELVVLHAIISGHLDVSSNKWKICVIERDVPCAQIAVKELTSLYNHLSNLAGRDSIWPEFELTVISSREFVDSPLHGVNKPRTDQYTSESFDVCIDVSMLLRHKIDKSPISINSKVYYVIRSCHYQQSQRHILTSSNIEYPPMVSKTAKGEYIEKEDSKINLKYFLNNIFRKTDFRIGQLPILSRILSNKTTIGLLPTGGGKSLTYQLACILQPGVSIIVDPLVSLMVDQYNGLKDMKIDSCSYVNSTLDRKERSLNLGKMQSGEMQFMLLSPERYMMPEFRSSLFTMSEKNHVYFAYGVIDEVHCVSEWGHDFRPAYLQLGLNMMRFMKTKSSRPLSIIGLTATASFDVLADVERELTLGDELAIDSDTIVRPEMETRAELTYRIVPVHTDFRDLKNNASDTILSKLHSERELKNIISESKRSKLIEILQKVPTILESINNKDFSEVHGTKIIDFVPSNFYNQDQEGKYPYSGIVFCPHKKGSFGVFENDYGTTKGIYEFLFENNVMGLSIGTFVGGDLPSKDMNTFKQNRQNVMIATKAFGMGIDKPNVRFTVNINHPSSIEDFVQSAGRGGRDRKNAISFILFDPTQYLHLSVNNIQDICSECYENIIPAWLWNNRNIYLLADDLLEFCKQNGLDTDQSKKFYETAQKYFENIDENVELFFHNQSFRGAFKEKLMLYEMTRQIMNAQPTNLSSIQEQLRESLSDDHLNLRLDSKWEGLSVYAEDADRQYGFLFLSNLRISYKYTSYDSVESSRVMTALVDIIQNLPDRTINWLNSPISTNKDVDEGIYKAMNAIKEDGCTFVTVSWSNRINMDYELYKGNIILAANDLATRYGWNLIDENLYGELKLQRVNTFIDLLNEISIRSNDPRWLQYHSQQNLFTKLLKAFCAKRDKDDTDKAIYRLSCIGLVEDVTIDYLSESYQLKIRKKAAGEYYKHMQRFFEKYYSSEKAQEKVEEIKAYPSENEIDKCIGYLTGFVYDTLAKKRRRAIEDIRYACYQGMSHGDDDLKEFIHLYFNSKYARDNYEIDGVNYSLSDDVVKEKRCDFELVNKYIKVISIDDSGSEIDNVKHLYGAVLLNLRDKADNYALYILRAYCLAFLGIGDNEILLRDFKLSLLDQGFARMTDGYTSEEIFKKFDQFLAILKRISHDSKVDEYLKTARNKLSLLIFGGWFIDFAERYMGKN